MKIDLNQNPRSAVKALVGVAHSSELFWFIGNAISLYFTRLTQFEDMSKLVECGLRPVLSPMAAEAALKRVQYVRYSEAWVHAVVADDAEAARLALRAVAYYADRFAKADLEKVSNEVGEMAMQVKDAAQFLAIAFDISQFEV